MRELRGELKGIATPSQQVGQARPIQSTGACLLGNTADSLHHGQGHKIFRRGGSERTVVKDSGRFSDTLAALHLFLTHRSCTHTVQQKHPLCSVVLPEFHAFHRGCTIATTFSSSNLLVHSGCRKVILIHRSILSPSRRSFERIYFQFAATNLTSPLTQLLMIQQKKACIDTLNRPFKSFTRSISS